MHLGMRVLKPVYALGHPTALRQNALTLFPVKSAIKLTNAALLTVTQGSLVASLVRDRVNGMAIGAAALLVVVLMIRATKIIRAY